MFSFLDVLFVGAPLIAEPHHSVRLHRQVGDNEAYARKQLARVLFDLCHHPAGLVPGKRQILEVAIAALDPIGRSANRPLEQMGDPGLQHRVGAQPDGIEKTSSCQRL